MRGFADNETLKDLIHKWPDQAIEYLYDHYYSSLVHVAEQRMNISLRSDPPLSLIS
jgi:hypothetical protein